MNAIIKSSLKQLIYLMRKIAQTPDLKILVPTAGICCLQTSALSEFPLLLAPSLMIQQGNDFF